MWYWSKKDRKNDFLKYSIERTVPIKYFKKIIKPKLTLDYRILEI